MALYSGERYIQVTYNPVSTTIRQNHTYSPIQRKLALGPYALCEANSQLDPLHSLYPAVRPKLPRKKQWLNLTVQCLATEENQK